MSRQDGSAPADGAGPSGPEHSRGPRPGPGSQEPDSGGPGSGGPGSGGRRRGWRADVRRIGLAILGLVGGLLAGVVVQDLIAPLLITSAGEVSIVGLFLLPLLIPLCGVAGAVLTVLLDARAR